MPLFLPRGLLAVRLVVVRLMFGGLVVVWFVVGGLVVVRLVFGRLVKVRLMVGRISSRSRKSHQKL